MLRISKLTDYAIVVMVELVRAQPAKGGEVLSAQVLAERAGVELPTASKVLKQLAGAGLVRSYRGPTGGYSVDCDSADISVADIIEAIEGPIAMTECSVHQGLCLVEDDCSARDSWQKISRAVADALEEISLAEMAGKVSEPGRIHGLRIATLNA